MTKYYVNGKQISKQEAEEIKKRKCEIAKEYRPKRLVRYSMDNRNKEIINNRVAFGLPQ